MSTESYYLSRVEQPVWFHAPENAAESDMFCRACGEHVLCGELIAEVDGDGMEYVHEACVGEDE